MESTNSLPAEITLGSARRDRAVMFADIVGYSRHMESDAVATASQVTRSVELFRSLIGDYGGELANIAGDNILALFESAESALRFAIQIQTEFRDQAVWEDGEKIEFRIGLHIGDVMIEHGNVQGHCVNVAARLQALAEPGGILISDAIRTALHDLTTIVLHPVGPQYLKNMAEPVETFAIYYSKRPLARLVDMTRQAPPLGRFRHPSMAVLPLANLSGDAVNDHLCEGISADIIASLSRFRSIDVIARHSSFMFNLKAHAAREIGQQLGVRYLLSGTLSRSEKRIRITVELIEAKSEVEVWSERFNFDLQQLFDFQDEITGAVASRLSVQIDLAERGQQRHPTDMRAFGLVLRGQDLILRCERETNLHARRLFEDAIELEGDYGRAHSALSRTHNLDWRYSWSDKPQTSLDAAVEFARRSIQLDRLDARGFSELGYALLYTKQHDDALSEYAHALELNPNDGDIIAEYADALVYAGEAEASIGYFERAMHLNPHYPDWYLWYLADAYDAMGRPEVVIGTVLRMKDPAQGRRMLAANYAHIGMLDEARAQAREVLRLHPDFSVSNWRQRPPHRDVAVLERYIEGMLKAGLPP